MKLLYSITFVILGLICCANGKFEGNSGDIILSSSLEVSHATILKMKKSNYLLSSIATVAMLTSCQKDNLGYTDDFGGVVIEISQDSKKRSSIDNLVTTWVSGDLLSVYNSSSKNAKFEYLGSTNSANATFNGQLTFPATDEVLYALYPYSIGDKSSTNTPLTLEASQIQEHNASGVIDPTSLGQYAYMAGKTTSSVASGNSISIGVTNLMSIFDFELTGIATNTKVLSVVLRSDANSFSTTGVVNFSGATPTVDVGAVDGKKIEVKLQTEGDPATEGVLVSGGRLVVRMAMLPQIIASDAEWFIDVNTFSGGENSTKTFAKSFASGAKTYGQGVCYKVAYSLGAPKPVVMYELVESDYIPSRQSTGDIIPDFSRVGYRWGDVDIPSISVVKILTPPAGGADATKLIQDAINDISRGTILLTKGVYNISGVININKSGIVLRGEGNDPTNGTKLVATKNTKFDHLILIAGTRSSRNRQLTGSTIAITDDYVPAGQFWVNVDNANSFNVDDDVVIYRPSTAKWISDLKMDQISGRPDGLPITQWEAGKYDQYSERVITLIEGNTLHFDNPIVMSLDANYGGGTVRKYTYTNRIEECGVENMYIESFYANDTDENHVWNAIIVSHAQHCWIKDIKSRYFAMGLVTMEKFSKNITVVNCHCFDPKSIDTGSRRYSFYIEQAELCLVKDCTSDNARHDYSTGSGGTGPNVFTNCTATNTKSDIGPHMRWNCGTLYDNIISDGDIRIQDRGWYGSGHGWAGANSVVWNSTARNLVVQSPWVSAYNYCIGSIGTKGAGAHPKPERPDGVWESNGANVSPQSLYEAQLLVRKKNQPGGIMDIKMDTDVDHGILTDDYTDGEF